MRTGIIAAMKRLDIGLCLALMACSPRSAALVSSNTLVPYSTITASPTSETLEGWITSNETPVPSPTPFNYVVVEGDTLSAISEKFGISLDDLQSVNSEVSPGSLAIGTVLKIPGGATDPNAESTPTPVPLSVKQIICHPDVQAGLWCFILIANEFSEPLENLSAQVTLLDASEKVIASQVAWLILDILPAGTVLPLTAYFAGGSLDDVHPQVQILTGTRLNPADDRYSPAILQNVLVEIDWSGRSAQVSGQVSLSEAARNAGTVWVAAVAYDRSGRLVGVRRWESKVELPAGGSLPFKLLVSSLADEIERVELAVQAKH